MKRKYISRSNWKRIEKSERMLINKYHERFEGYAAAIFVEKVRERLVCKLEHRDICIVDNGYTWIQRLPVEKNWTVTVMIDDKGDIVEWYFDITKLNSIDECGEPFYDDLYLDVVVLPSGEIMLLDEDELKEALESGDICGEDFDLAYREAYEIMNGIAKDIPFLAKMSYEDLGFFKEQMILKK